MVRRVAAVLSALAAVLLAAAVPAAAAPPAAPPAAAAVTAPVRAPSVAGADVLTRPGGSRCTLGYNVSGRGILTGACGPVGTTWYAGSVLVGSVSWVSADGVSALIAITNPAVVQLHGLRGPGGVLISITTAGTAAIGSTVSAVSPLTGVRSGRLTAVNQTIAYGGGYLTGLHRTTICPTTGEGGVPIFRSSTALSIGVGGSGTCSSGGTTYGRPVTQLLAALGRTIY